MSLNACDEAVQDFVGELRGNLACEGLGACL